jgi:hypothetical protein
MFAQWCPRCRSRRVQLGYNETPILLQLICVHEILCNNCNLEFRGFALPGALKRVPSPSVEEQERGKRRAPRFKIKLPLNVSLLKVDGVSTGIRYSTELSGYTHVISKVGMALILPSLKFGGAICNDTSRRLHVGLSLPTGLVNIYINPVNFTPFNEKRNEWIVGARITKIGNEDRVRFYEYINNLNEKMG